MTSPAPRRHRLRSLSRAFSWHRRKLAVIVAVAAVLTGITAAHPPPPATIPAVRATHAIPGGTILVASDLQVDQVLAADAPADVLPEPGVLLGRVVAGPVADGQMMGPLALVSDRTTLAPGHVIAPLRLADVDLAALLHPGERVDVLAANTQAARARVVASGVRVVTVPATAQDIASQSGALVLVETTAEEATALAAAAVTGPLTILWPGGMG